MVGAFEIFSRWGRAGKERAPAGDGWRVYLDDAPDFGGNENSSSNCSSRNVPNAPSRVVNARA